MDNQTKQILKQYCPEISKSFEGLEKAKERNKEKRVFKPSSDTRTDLLPKGYWNNNTIN